MTEKDLQNKYIQLLNKLEIPFIHLKNAGSKRGSYNDCLGESCLKNFSDLLFPWKGQLHFRELSVKGQHLDRKAKQTLKAKWWLENIKGTFRIITSEEGMLEDWGEVGLIDT